MNKAQDREPAGKKRVLIIEDQELIRDSTTQILEHMGFSVESAENGQEGIEIYKKAIIAGKFFDAVIMDLNIPGGMEGEEAIAKIREIDPGVRAIVSSGYPDHPVMSEFKKYGFNGAVHKPYGMKEIKDILDKVMTGKEA